MVSRGFGLAPGDDPEQRPEKKKRAKECNLASEDLNDSPEDPQAKQTGPHTFGEERHPSIVIFWGRYGTDRAGAVTLERVSVIPAEGSGYRLSGEVDRHPPTDGVELAVFGTRKGDTDRLVARVDGADPAVFVVDTESPTLYRWGATGCLVCRGEQA